MKDSAQGDMERWNSFRLNAFSIEIAFVFARSQISFHSLAKAKSDIVEFYKESRSYLIDLHQAKT